MLCNSCNNYLILALCAIPLLIYFIFKRAFTYWERLGVATIPSSIPFGHAGNPITRKHAFYVTAAEIYSTLKPQGHKYAGFYALTSPALIVIDPELIKRVLIRDFPKCNGRGLYYNIQNDPLTGNLFFIDGDKWKVMRAKLTPTFTSGKMKMMFDTLLACTEPMLDAMQQSNLDIKELMGCFSTDVIGSCAFGVECNSFKQPDAAFRKYGRKTFEFSITNTFSRYLQMIFPSVADKLNVVFVPRDVSKFFIEAVTSTIKMREEQHIERKDFMQLLLDLKRAGVLESDQLAAQAFVFFIAGFETSSTTMTHCLYELAKHPDIQEKLRAEINSFDEFNYDNVMNAKLLQQVVDETLRKYPVLPYLNRICNEDFQIDERLTLKKGQKLLISVMGLHMDPAYFPRPNDFNPDRFSDANKANIVPYTYIPFGEGPRLCIGMRFGLMQTKVGIASILKRFRLSLSDRTPQELTWDANSFLLKSNETIYINATRI